MTNESGDCLNDVMPIILNTAHQYYSTMSKRMQSFYSFDDIVNNTVVRVLADRNFDYKLVKARANSIGKNMIIYFLRRCNQSNNIDTQDMIPYFYIESEYVSKLFRKEIRRKVFKHLTRREKMVIILFYFRGLSTKQIATMIGLTHHSVSVLHSKAMAKIKSLYGDEDRFLSKSLISLK